ncbi:MAG: glycosyltransferase family 2 protein [Selenomonadaceae bacterium]|nr:glycosyltransferase family 2 protein [Selenomonadaceae bacterium]
MNKIAVVMMVKNEIDVIESCVRHAATYADDILICDHMSTDGTLEVLKSLKDEGLPIEISRCFDTKQDQQSVTTNLVHESIRRGANIILPTDADEFLIMVGGKDSKDLRTFLQNLDPNQVYEIHWTQCEFIDAEKDQEQFTLDRPALKSLPKAPSLWRSKAVIGSGAWQNFKLRTQRGNHFTEYLDGKAFDKYIRIYEIENFHYRYRSNGQWLSKDLCKFLARILNETMYGDMGAKIMLNNVKNFLSQDNFELADIEPLPNMLPPTSSDLDLAPYRNTCHLKYSHGGGVDPLKNVFRYAIAIAIDSKLKDVFALKWTVRIFVFHEGDANKTNRSIESAINQSYPFIKVHVVLLTMENADKLNLNEKMAIVESKNFAKVVMRSSGDFVQFVVPGDILMRDRITDMIQMFFTDKNYHACFSEAVYPNSTQDLPNFLNVKYDPKFPGGRFYRFRQTKGMDFFKDMLKTGQILRSGVTRALFKQECFKNEDLLQAWVTYGDIRARQLILWNAVVVPAFTFVNDPMIESDDVDWSRKQLIIFLQIWNMAVEDAQKAKFLSNDDYKNAKKGIKEWQTRLSQ